MSIETIHGRRYSTANLDGPEAVVYRSTRNAIVWLSRSLAGPLVWDVRPVLAARMTLREALHEAQEREGAEAVLVRALVRPPRRAHRFDDNKAARAFVDAPPPGDDGVNLFVVSRVAITSWLARPRA